MQQRQTPHMAGLGGGASSGRAHLTQPRHPSKPLPPFGKRALERLPFYFCAVIYLGDWNAAYADPRPAVLIPEDADPLSYDMGRIFKATPSRDGIKAVIVERGRIPEDLARIVAMKLLAIGFDRVIVVNSSFHDEDGCPLRVYGGGQ